VFLPNSDHVREINFDTIEEIESVTSLAINVRISLIRPLNQIGSAGRQKALCQSFERDRVCFCEREVQSFVR